MESLVTAHLCGISEHLEAWIPKVMDKYRLHTCDKSDAAGAHKTYLYVHSAPHNAEALKCRHHTSEVAFPIKNVSVPVFLTHVTQP